MPVLKEVLDALNIPRYELAGWEADDLIGTITRQCEHRRRLGLTGVATGDQDALQLVSDQTYVELVHHPHGPDHHPGDGPGCFPGGVRL